MPSDRGAAGTQKRGIAVPRIPTLLVYIVGFVPAVWLFYAGVNDRLGADPMRYLEQSLGLWALRFLIGSLAVTPLRQSLGINLLRYRRAIGLLAFYYAALHLLTYLVLDQGLDGSAILADILKRPYITIGMATFVILVPVAVTSNNLSIRKLGGQVWARIHKLVYVAAIGAALHFLLVVKSWPMEPLVYTAIVAALLGYRVVKAFTRKPSPRRRAA
ncbi:protein-methionine-sulfoxide reductase heme-binding subunit MsrQ [Microvirga pudoricolor]|uniref:protein-methionine-sulfoxide reductase heme-binding subunit MsrQ n=1 Tax=Microvirga pudoricolor TaxID=2778729 RepID=UPI00195206EA|nr:protein-methionine-sulfoxide reductase heme-binding subunit MsrQ [Microvirga pudoricolor]MBM6595869.1 protein-methionine-sulfoxide reductase heme-binding subunit MsrQ [Microvirga pudoricolor]